MLVARADGFQNGLGLLNIQPRTPFWRLCGRTLI